MSTETRHQYQSLLAEAERHTVIVQAGELLTTDATVELVMAAINAFSLGLTVEEISAAINEGEKQGVILSENLHSGNDPEYWKAVQAEAQAFWERRYSPDAPEDWS